jgi:hypothetical protein
MIAAGRRGCKKRTARLLLVAGVVQQEEGVTNVLAGHISRLDT